MSDVTDNTPLPVFRVFDLFDHYWLADDGRVFSSLQKSVVSASDPGYVEFLATGPATRWPEDENGNQTDAALQAVFDQAGIKIGGESPKTPFITVNSTGNKPPKKK
jgi:hypothetical protein